VPSAVIRRRGAALRALAAEKNHAFRRRLLGQTRDVLVLDAPDRATGHRVGLTASYVEVGFAGPTELGRRFVPLTITECAPDAPWGALGAVPACPRESRPPIPSPSASSEAAGSMTWTASPTCAGSRCAPRSAIRRTPTAWAGWGTAASSSCHGTGEGI